MGKFTQYFKTGHQEKTYPKAWHQWVHYYSTNSGGFSLGLAKYDNVIGHMLAFLRVRGYFVRIRPIYAASNGTYTGTCGTVDGKGGDFHMSRTFSISYDFRDVESTVIKWALGDMEKDL